MSTLQQSLNHRRAAESADAGCIVAAAQSPALVIRTWQGPSWVLPWSHFVSARLDDSGSRLEIAFTNCLVVVTGDALGGLVEELAAFRIGGLRDLPASYRKKINEGEPFIARIEVRAAAEPAPHPDKTG